MYNNTSIEGQLDLEIDEIDSAYTKQNNITHHSIMIEADAIIERNFDDGSRSIVLNEREIAILSLAAIQSLPPIVYAHTSSLLDGRHEKYQIFLYGYMGISLNDQAIFLKKLMDEVRKNIDHVHLVPIFQLFHAQIHALVIAYTKFKNKILQVDNWNPQNRILLGIIGMELAKNNVRYYLVEEKVGTNNRDTLSWVEVFDWIFDNFEDREIFDQEGFGELFDSIKDTRDTISDMKGYKKNAQILTANIIAGWKNSGK